MQAEMGACGENVDWALDSEDPARDMAEGSFNSVPDRKNLLEDYPLSGIAFEDSAREHWRTTHGRGSLQKPERGRRSDGVARFRRI